MAMMAIVRAHGDEPLKRPAVRACSDDDIEPGR
jgi:hypothetical protein